MTDQKGTVIPKLLELANTTFQNNPIAEVITKDPFKTLDLKILNDAELDIDQLASLLDGLLPPELSSLIQDGKRLVDYLKQTGKTVEQFVDEVSKMLPASLDLATLLRDVDITDLAGSGKRILDLVSSKTLTSLAPEFLSKAVKFMTELKCLGGNGGTSNGLTSGLPITATAYSPPTWYPKLTGAKISDIKTPDHTAIAAIALAYIATMKPKPPLSNIKVGGNGATASLAIKILPVLPYTTGQNLLILYSLANSVSKPTFDNIVDKVVEISPAITPNFQTVVDQVVGLSSTDKLLEFQNELNAMPADLVQSLGTALDNSSTPITISTLLTVAEIVQHTGIATIDLLTGYGNVFTVGIDAYFACSPILTQSPLGVDGIAAITINAFTLNNFSVANYNAKFGESADAQPILTLMEQYGIDDIDIMNDVSPLLSVNDITTLVAIPYHAVNSVVAMINNSSAVDTVATLTHLQSYVDEQITVDEQMAVLAKANVLLTPAVVNTIFSIMGNVTEINFGNAASIITAIINSSPVAVLASRQALTELPMQTVVNMAMVINVDNPVEVLKGLSLPYDITKYVIQRAAVISAERGQYADVKKIVNYAPQYFDKAKKKYLVGLILKNFTIPKDDSGYDALDLAEVLVVMLNVISDDWLFKPDVMHPSIDLNMLQHMSEDAKRILMLHPLTQVQVDMVSTLFIS